VPEELAPPELASVGPEDLVSVQAIGTDHLQQHRPALENIPFSRVVLAVAVPVRVIALGSDVMGGSTPLEISSGAKVGDFDINRVLPFEEGRSAEMEHVK